jgi:hypothetical protein
MAARQCSRDPVAEDCASASSTPALRRAPHRRAHENERRPILERQAVYEDEAAGAIASERGGGLRHEQAREHHVPFGRNEPCYRRC